MIKTKYGKVEAHGTCSELLADLTVIVHSIYHEVLLDEMSEEAAEEMICQAVEAAFEFEDEQEDEGKEKELAVLLKELQGVIEEIENLKEGMSKKKGQGEE